MKNRHKSIMGPTRNEGRRRFSAAFLVFLALTLSAYTATTIARAQQAAYLEERPTNRLALVVGNFNYAHYGTLQSATVDAQQMTAMLRKLGFTVFEVHEIRNSAEFWNVHFLPFANKVSEDDFALFYFSGHGFSYGGENFIAMIDAEKTLQEANALDVLVGANAIRELLGARKPGLTMLILDACRTIGGSIQRSDGSKSDLAKGPSPIPALADNITIGFSSDFGRVSKARDEAGQMSYYTEALLNFLGEADREFQYVKRNTRLRTIAADADAFAPLAEHDDKVLGTAEAHA